MKRMVYVVLCAVLLTAISGALAFAQMVNAPDEGVRGYGAINTSTKGVATFDVNVARTGINLIGGFKYSEASTTSTRGHTIYSQRITELTFEGNKATIKAIGYWNGMLSDVTIVALDDLNMDWFHITAKPRNMLQIIYDQAGGLIKGDIVVYSKPVPEGYVKGEGMIAVKSNAGRFSMHAQKIGTAVKGSVYYYEYNPMIMSIYQRPINKIYLPAVQSLEFSGFYAILKGRGYLNGRPAMIEVRAMDAGLADWLVYTPDEFHITATPLFTSSAIDTKYYAGGPVITGDVEIKTKQ